MNGTSLTSVDTRPSHGVGDVAAGQSLADLYSLVATCESRGINSFEYFADVLARVQDHPANAIDDLLLAAWAAAN